MLAGLGVPIPLGKAEIYDVDEVLLFAVTNQKVIWLHVSMNKMIVMDKFKSLNHLVGQHQSSLDGQFSLAIVEDVFQTRSQQVHDHRVIISFNAKPVD